MSNACACGDGACGECVGDAAARRGPRFGVAPPPTPHPRLRGAPRAVDRLTMHRSTHKQAFRPGHATYLYMRYDSLGSRSATDRPAGKPVGKRSRGGKRSSRRGCRSLRYVNRMVDEATCDTSLTATARWGGQPWTRAQTVTRHEFGASASPRARSRPPRDHTGKRQGLGHDEVDHPHDGCGKRIGRVADGGGAPALTTRWSPVCISGRCRTCAPRKTTHLAVMPRLNAFSATLMASVVTGVGSLR